MRKPIIYSISLILFLLAVWVSFRMYNKPHRDPATESSISISAVELLQAFEKNESKAYARYLDKTLSVRGKVAELTYNLEMTPIIVLETDNPMFGVRCTMANPKIDVRPGDLVTIKGVCTGYLTDVIIIKSMVIKE